MLLVSTEMFEDMLVEFDFEVGINTGPVSLFNINLSQFDLEEILLFIQKQNKNLVRIQKLLIILKRRAKPKPNHRFQGEIVTLSLFDRKASEVEEFVAVCMLYLKMRMRRLIVKE